MNIALKFPSAKVRFEKGVYLGELLWVLLLLSAYILILSPGLTAVTLGLAVVTPGLATLSPGDKLGDSADDNKQISGYKKEGLRKNTSVTLLI